MSSTEANKDACQIDFYRLDNPSIDTRHFACRLAMMAWERKQKIFIVTDSETAIGELDELLWQYPEGRFLPHAVAGQSDAGLAVINIGTLSSLNPVDVVINLSNQAVPQPVRFSRVLEIVPNAESERDASRTKFKTYRDQGIHPRTHEINK